MRTFLISYATTDLSNNLVGSFSEKIELVNCEGLSDGKLAQFIIQYLKSITNIGGIILYNFWEIKTDET